MDTFSAYIVKEKSNNELKVQAELGDVSMTVAKTSESFNNHVCLVSNMQLWRPLCNCGAELRLVTIKYYLQKLAIVDSQRTEIIDLTFVRELSLSLLILCKRTSFVHFLSNGNLWLI